MRIGSSQPRLVAALASALLLIAAIGFVGYAQLRKTSRAYQQLVDRDARLTKDALEIKVAVNEEAAGIRGYVLSGGDDVYLQSYARAGNVFGLEVASAREKTDDAATTRRLERISELHEQLQRIYAREIALVDSGRSISAARLARRDGRPIATDLLGVIDGLVTSEASRLYANRAQVGSLERTSEVAILGVLVLALSMGAVVAALAVRAARRGAGAEAEAEAARASADEEAALGRIARAIANEAEPAAVLRAAAVEAASLLGAASAAILRFEPASPVAQVVGAAGHAAALAGERVAVEPGDILAACREDRAAAMPGSAERPGLALLRRGRVGAELAVPIHIGATVWGVLWVAVTPGQNPAAGAARRLERFAELASASISSADARAHLAQLANEDGLTGLANHRTFHERLHEEVSRAQRHDRKLAVVLLDLDHFKEVNDTHGHQVGDAVLRETAERLAACARKGEVIARIGGEEFAWLLPEADAMEAFQAAERARRRLSASPMTAGVRMTASAGVCDLDQAGNANELIRLADGALFWAKAHGRDITFRYSPDVVTELSAADQLEHLRKSRTIVGIRALARAVDVKDASTARHSERVAELAMAMADALGWQDRRLAQLHEAALIHDVGKIGVPDAILFKPGRLDEDEYEAVRQHSTLSAQIVSDVLSEEQVAWVLGHHERWDGRGYPDGLAADAIPPGAQLLALADAWDVMTSARPYSSARSVGDALDEVRRESGLQFSPTAVAALERVIASGAVVARPDAAVAATGAAGGSGRFVRERP